MFLVILLAVVLSVFSGKHHLMDQTEKEEDKQLSSGQYTSACGLSYLTSTLNQAHQKLPPSTKFFWTQPCPSKVQLFLCKLLNESLLTSGSNISSRCKSDPKIAAHDCYFRLMVYHSNYI